MTSKVSLVERAPQFGNLPERIELSSKAELSLLVDEVRLALRAFQENTKYDRLLYAELLARQAAAARHDMPWCVPPPCRLCGIELARKHQSGHCAALASLFAEQLCPRLPAHVAGAHLPPKMQGSRYPQLCHAAVVIGLHGKDALPLGQGYLLCDVGFGQPDPVVVWPTVPFVAHEGTQTTLYRLQGEGSETEIVSHPTTSPGQPPLKARKQRELTTRYLVAPFLNLDEALTEPLAAVDDRLPIVARDALGRERAAMVLNLKNNTLTQRWQLEDGTPMSTVTRLSGTEHHASHLKSIIEVTVAAALGSTPLALAARLSRVLAHRSWQKDLG